MKKILQALTIMAISGVVMLLTVSLSSRGLFHHGSKMVFSTAHADDSDDDSGDGHEVSGDDEHEDSGDGHEVSGDDDEHEDSGDGHEVSGDDDGHDDSGDDEHDDEHDDDEHEHEHGGGTSPDNSSSFHHQTPKVQQY